MSWRTPSLSGLGGESAKIGSHGAFLNASYIVIEIDRFSISKLSIEVGSTLENLTLDEESTLSARYRRSDYTVALDFKIKAYASFVSVL